MKNNKKLIIKWICLIIWMSIIFILSNQPNSYKVTYDIIDNTLIKFNISGITSILNIIIRKSGHITEFLILTILFISLIKEYTNNNIKIILSSLIFSFLYACSDEFHQSFIYMRSGVFSDVIIDLIGVIIALLFYYIFNLIKKKKG